MKIGNCDPQISQTGQETTLPWIPDPHMESRAVDATAMLGRLMDLKCTQPKNTDLATNPRETLDGDPVA